jgi:hypothetical protein
VKIDQVYELWRENFADLEPPEMSWIHSYASYETPVVAQAFEAVAQWRARHKPQARTLDVCKMAKSKCRLIDTGEIPLRETQQYAWERD